MRIYISGPISGQLDYQMRFKAAESILKAAGYTPYNPAEILQNLPDDSTWEEIMKIDIKLLDMCDGIYMMNGWRKSKGAGIEFEHACENKKLIMFEGGVMP